MSSKTSRLFPVFVVWLLAMPGCTVPPPIDLPDLTNPGPAAYQQRRANRWDAYPETDAGPALDGARPREFVSSNPEPTRARWSFWPFSGQ